MPIQTLILPLVLLFMAGACGLALTAMLVGAFFTVEQGTTGIVQRLGKFMREAGPGFHIKIPFIDKVTGRINLRVQQLDVRIESKTADNVFVKMVVAVQYCVLSERVYDAFYMLDDATRHMTSFVFDIVRAHVPKIKLAYLFEEKDELADIVKSELAQVMEGFGFRILKALVTDIEMDARVKESMIAASARKSDILISRSPDELDSLSEQMRNDWIEGDQTAGATEQGRGALPELKTGPQGFHVPEGPEHPTAPNPHGNGAQFMPQGRKIIVDDRVISWLVRRNS